MLMALEVGAELGPYRFEHIEQRDMTALAGILRDPNPIHLDAAVVRSLGLGEHTVNQGPANMGYLLNMLMDAAPGAHVSSLRLRFVGNLFEGETAVACGTVDRIERIDGVDQVECTVWLAAEPDRQALAGTATLLLAAAPSEGETET